jgi:hypothetical protein
MQAAKIAVMIPEDHRLVVTLPPDLPPGPAEIIVLAALPKKVERSDRRAALGMDRGAVRISEDFDAPLPDDLQRAFDGEP